jgi:hypothetical protein
MYALMSIIMFDIRDWGVCVTVYDEYAPMDLVKYWYCTLV